MEHVIILPTTAPDHQGVQRIPLGVQNGTGATGMYPSIQHPLPSLNEPVLATTGEMVFHHPQVSDPGEPSKLAIPQEVIFPNQGAATTGITSSFHQAWANLTVPWQTRFASGNNNAWTFLLIGGGLILLLVVIGGIVIIVHNSQDWQGEKDIQYFIPTNILNDHLATELRLAVNNQDDAAVRDLVERGANINAINSELETPLIRAAKYTDKWISLRMIKYLVDNHADVYRMDRGGYTFLHELFRVGDNLTPTQFHDIATYLISKHLARLFNIRDTSSFGYSPLLMAVKFSNVDYKTLALLRNNGADFRLVDNFGNSILVYVIQGKRSIQAIDNLIELGADWRRKGQFNRNLLHTAASHCHVDAATYFFNKGLALNEGDSNGETPLHLAVLHGTENIFQTVRLLVAMGADLEIQNRWGRTPLANAFLNSDNPPDMAKVVNFLEGKMVK